MKSEAKRCDQEQREQLVVEPLAGDLVEGAERLVEEEPRRVPGERAGERDPHLHAAGQPPRVVALEAGEADEVDRLCATGGALGLAHPVQLEQQLDVATDAAPRQERGVLEHVTEVGRAAVDSTSPPVWSTRPDATLSNVDLPQPEGPTMATISPAATENVASAIAWVPSG